MPPRAANTKVRSTRRPRVHAVGMTGAALGLASLAALPFATFRSSRIQTGDDLSALASLGPWWLGAIAAVWVALVVLSLGNDRRETASAARGLLGAVALLGTLMLSAVAAERLLADGPEFARVSIGMGAWACMIAGYMVVLASRRELAERRALAAVLGALAPVGIVVLLGSGALADLGMLKEYASQSERFWAEVGAHVLFAAVSMAIAIVSGVSLGVLAFRRPAFKRPVFAVVSIFQTIPGLAMVGLLFAPLSWLGANVPLFERLGVGGLGWAPVILALTLYALLAVVRNTYAGLEGVPPATVDAALGMGMTEWQVMRTGADPARDACAPWRRADLDRADRRERDARRLRGCRYARALRLRRPLAAGERSDHARVTRDSGDGAPGRRRSARRTAAASALTELGRRDVRPMIRLEHVSKRYSGAGRDAVSDVTLEVLKAW